MIKSKQENSISIKDYFYVQDYYICVVDTNIYVEDYYTYRYVFLTFFYANEIFNITSWMYDK